MDKRPEAILFLSDARGVYIPRDFAAGVRRDCLSGVRDGDMVTLAAGPEHEWYWDAWQSVCDNATVTDPATGVRYAVWQDGDCWLLPEGMEISDYGSFGYPEDSQT
jgi:hypothetical protein